ncbi:SUPPRESSOR OF TY 6 (SPT6)-RELATED protein, putative [Babesia bigemina]|uniref:SUPPRESSOR OF TY 6 (SPT6)-RELATED protein, putative n=1 Tax=Babesia bigemina TaxID=5866 RepID=A0A061D6V5_BABBI|nr:SUPPRESSOR OF TY 6 (SPT6)-RELATED protein, putative [Babesia bigemina]CDR96431.1 SUPPRESSOR OF TY 6 (SPT6)-RELATED protein, putative [Babesia bigemina]|eukprot:XP_012768617.1 SUPPRESSOR OF TY 6 (SPT6)-RELATED protein, putative [Babesia bigemina]
MSDSGAPDAAEAASELKRKRVSSIEDETEEEQPDAVDVPSKSPFKAARVESADYKSIRSKYLDTMAEESEEDAAAAADRESDSESDSDDEAELGSEIPDEMKGFIVDKVDDDEVSVESDVSDVEYDPDVLDDDDLALIAENTGAKFEQEDDDYGAKQLRRLKKGSAVAKRQEEYDNWLEDEYIEQGDLDLSDIWATVAECFGDVDLVVQILKNERTVQPREEAAVSDYESEYVEPATQEVTLESLADPDELAKEYMTKQDEAIREHDEPERLYIRYRNRPRHTDDREIKDEAQWIARRLISEFSDDLSVERVRKMYDLVFRGTYPSPQISPEEDIREKCEMVLVWLLNERWEVPFILHHKRHLICPPLTDDIVWRVYHLDAEWIKLKTMAERIKDIIDRIGYEELPNDVLYYALNFNTLEDLQDVNGHLRYHHRKAMYEETPVEDQPPEKPLQPAIPAEDPVPLEDGIMGDDIEDEDDVFGDFAFGGHTLETTADPQHFRSPSSVPISPMSAMSSPLDRMDDPAEPVHGDAGPRILPAKKTSIIPPDSPAEGDPFDETNQEFGSGDDENHDLSGRVAERGGGDNGDVDDEAQLDDDDDDDDTDHHADNREGLDMSADDMSDDEDVDMDVDGNQRSDHAPAHSTDLLEMDDDHLKDDYEEEDELPDHRITEIATSMKSLEVQTTTKRPHMKQRSVDMHLIDTIEKGGFHELWRGYIADARQFATVLEKSLTPGSTELRIQMDQVRAQWKELGAVGMLDAPSIIEGSEEQQVEDMCAQFCRPPYSGGKRLYTALVSYHTKMLAHDITIRRLLREYYRNYCSITCTTTTKGEAEVDVADASWPARRLYRMPLRELTTYRQVHYSYPTSATTREERYRILDSHRRGTALAEMYLQIVQLEKEGAIKCTIHPICAQEVPAWKADGFGDRFAEWYERYKVVTYSGNQLVSESYRTRMGEQKAILEKEEMLLKDAEERDKQWRRQLLDQLVMAYCPSNVPTYSIWRHIQKEILSRLINVELIPKFRMEIREELWRNAQSFVLLHCQRMLQYKLDVNPSPSETVLALAVDAEPQRVYATVVNEFGDMKDYKRLDRLIAHPIMPRNATPSNPLFKEVMEDIDVLCDMVANFRISVVLVAMSNTGAVTLYNRLETYMVPNIKVPLTIKKLDVEVPRLRVSMLPRASVNDLCLSMARWYIDPVAETLNLWSQNSTNLLLKLNLHPFQHVISQEKLQEYLECTLVHMVCHFGVDINRVKNSKHLEATLQFVAGLGPRKTMDVLRLLKIAAIGTRSQLRMGQAAIRGLGELVFYNCASFIKISSNEAMDILDTTRLHPVECYYTAEKLCTDSLDYDLGGEEAIQEIFNNPKRLDDLDLEAYSSLLMEKRSMPRMLPYLLFVKHELQSPFHDYRADLQELREEEEFCLALQIDHLLLRRGAHVMCRLEEVYEHTIRACVLPLELKAHVVDYRNFRDDVYRISKEQNRTIQLRGICISARVSNVEYAPNFENGRCAYRVEVALTGQQRRYLLLDLFDDVKRVLGIREDHLSPLVHFDVNYSKKPMLNEHSEKHKIHYRRVIRHPSYRMWPLNKIVAFLKQPEIGIGECCICPMSEWDRLNLVIKTCAEPFNCATFVIHERNQRVPGELGKELILLNQTYTSIDQIIAQFCETLKLNLEEIYMHPKFKHSTDISKAERDLIQESAMRPDGIAWAILPPHPMQHRGSQVRYNPLRFTLLVMPPSMELTQGARSLQDSIYVDHRSFKLWTHHEKSLASLIKWWKQVGYWNRNRHRELYNQEKAALMRQGAAPQMRH